MTDSFHDAVAADELDYRRKAVEAIAPYHGARQGRLAFEKEEAKHAEVLRRWLNEHPDEDLSDDERGLVVSLESSGATITYERPRLIWDKDASLFGRLLELDVLVVDPTKLKAAMAKGEVLARDMERWVATRGERTPRLIVKEIKE